jgi:5-methylcytosine-specific restriction protein A
MPTVNEFQSELASQISRASKQGRPHVEINAGELHRTLGNYPSQSHSMPSCCDAMRSELDLKRDQIIYETESGQSASLTIRYALPR